eukprot:scaffold8182_cov172-Pinguiococcus_pyrenoidosus.AAC.2
MASEKVCDRTSKKMVKFLSDADKKYRLSVELEIMMAFNEAKDACKILEGDSRRLIFVAADLLEGVMRSIDTPGLEGLRRIVRERLQRMHRPEDANFPRLLLQEMSLHTDRVLGKVRAYFHGLFGRGGSAFSGKNRFKDLCAFRSASFLDITAEKVFGEDASARNLRHLAAVFPWAAEFEVNDEEMDRFRKLAADWRRGQGKACSDWSSDEKQKHSMRFWSGQQKTLPNLRALFFRLSCVSINSA